MMSRELRKGDPFQLFTFLIVAKDFNMLVKRIVDLGKLKALKFQNGEERFTHIRYVDDTLIVGK